MSSEVCPRCLKDQALCVCARIEPIPTRTHVLFLQHPQEPDKDLGSARLAHLALPNSTLKIGLSWPNLKKASGLPDADPSRWAVLYLGSGAKVPTGQKLRRLEWVDKNGKSLPVVPAAPLTGLIVLDGTWSQAKTLWWRNAWLLKLRRVILNPQAPSLYKELRREPRRECLSTIESVALCLEELGEASGTGDRLRALFSELLTRKRAMRPTKPVQFR